MWKVYDDKVESDIAKLKSDGIYDKYKRIKEALEINPYNPPNVSKKHFGKLAGQKKNSEKWHIDINSKRKIFYTINNGEIEIEEITYQGIVDIISAYEHDL